MLKKMFRQTGDQRRSGERLYVGWGRPSIAEPQSRFIDGYRARWADLIDLAFGTGSKTKIAQ